MLTQLIKSKDKGGSWTIWRYYSSIHFKGL